MRLAVTCTVPADTVLARVAVVVGHAASRVIEPERIVVAIVGSSATASQSCRARQQVLGDVESRRSDRRADERERSNGKRAKTEH